MVGGEEEEDTAVATEVVLGEEEVTVLTEAEEGEVEWIHSSCRHTHV